MKSICIKTKLVIVLLSVALLGCSNGNTRKGHSGGPPPEAYKACEEKKDGDSVSFSGFRGETVAASCKTIDGKLVAVPNDKPKKGGR
ncbi:MAG: hypothetical protein OQK12_09475 [Motiliproteus sp.]|nr:hypothetical protein [Motiliproteus sp.]MCW9052368.1 hypothetical protein [Motiliproteus sp.]